MRVMGGRMIENHVAPASLPCPRLRCAIKCANLAISPPLAVSPSSLGTSPLPRLCPPVSRICPKRDGSLIGFAPCRRLLLIPPLHLHLRRLSTNVDGQRNRKRSTPLSRLRSGPPKRLLIMPKTTIHEYKGEGKEADEKL